MAYRVYFKRKDNCTELYLGGEWDERLETDITSDDLKRLGKLFLRLARGFKRSFTFKPEALKSELCIYAKRSFFRKNALLRFEFICTHPHFNVPCDNRFNYYGFTRKELKAFGKALSDFDKSGLAELG